MSEIEGTVQCALCHAIISCRPNDKIKFELHLRIEHMVNFDTDIILALCLMNQEEMEAVKTVMFSKFEQSSSDEVESGTPDEPESKEVEETDLKGSKAVSTNGPEEFISCETCNKNFKSKNSLSKHKSRKICSPKMIELEEVIKHEKNDEETAFLKDVTDEDLAKSVYFNSSIHPVIRRYNQENLEEFNEEDISLPGWKIRSRKVLSDHKRNGVMTKRMFLTPDGKRKILTALGVIEYLRLQGRKESELYSLAMQLGVDRRRFAKLYLNEMGAGETLAELSDMDISKSRYFSHESSSPVIRKVMKNTLHEYREKDKLLPGWLIKNRVTVDIRRPGGQRKLRSFLTPDKKRSITTSIGVLEYLRLQGKDKRSLLQIAAHLGVDKTKFESLFTSV